VWACVLEINSWRRRGDPPEAGYQRLCTLLTQSGPGTFGELDTTGTRSVLRRYSDAWFSAAARRKAGALEVRYPRRRRSLLPVRWYHGTFTLAGRRLRLPTARGYPPLLVRLDRPVPYPAGTVRSVIAWAVDRRIGTLTVGDPRGVLNLPAGRRHNLRLRQWQIGRTLRILQDKAALAGIRVCLVDERGTSSTCPNCQQKISKPRGRVMTCPHCRFAGHRDLAAAFTIATRTPGGATTTPPTMGGVATHRRAGRHLPGVRAARRDPRRRPPPAAAGSLGRRRPAPPPLVGSRSPTSCERGSTTPPNPTGERCVDTALVSKPRWSDTRRHMR
jgi:IS605 OrfB family transposase